MPFPQRCLARSHPVWLKGLDFSSFTSSYLGCRITLLIPHLIGSLSGIQTIHLYIFHCNFAFFLFLTRPIYVILPSASMYRSSSPLIPSFSPSQSLLPSHSSLPPSPTQLGSISLLAEGGRKGLGGGSRGRVGPHHTPLVPLRRVGVAWGEVDGVGVDGKVEGMLIEGDQRMRKKRIREKKSKLCFREIKKDGRSTNATSWYLGTWNEWYCVRECFW